MHHYNFFDNLVMWNTTFWTEHLIIIWIIPTSSKLRIHKNITVISARRSTLILNIFCWILFGYCLLNDSVVVVTHVLLARWARRGKLFTTEKAFSLNPRFPVLNLDILNRRGTTYKTSLTKSLDDGLSEKTIRSRYDALQSAWEDVQSKHDEYMETISDHPDIEEQDSWIDSVSADYFAIQGRVDKHL